MIQETVHFKDALFQSLCQTPALAQVMLLAKKTLGAGYCGVLLVDAACDRLQVCLDAPLPPPFLSNIQQAFNSLPNQNRRAFLATELFEAPSYMRLPLYLEDKAIGCLVIFGAEESQLEAGRSLARLAESLLQNTLLRYQAQTHATLHQIAYDLTRLMNDDAELGVVLVHIIERAVALTHCDGAEVMLLEPNETGLRVAAQSGRVLIHEPNEHIIMDKGLVGRVAAEQKSVWVENYQTYPHGAPQTPSLQQIGAVIGVPLICKDALVGVLVTYCLLTSPSFNEDDLKILEGLAPLAAIAIDKAQLIDAVRQERKQLQAVLDHVHAPIMLFDPKGKLILANPQAHQVGQRLGISLYKMIGHSFADLLSMLPPHIEVPRRFTPGTAIDVNLRDAGEFIVRVEEVPQFRGLVGGGFVVIWQEVTGERQLTRSRSELLHVMAHDLGNILSLALGYSSLLVSEPTTEEEAKLYQQQVFEALQRGRSLIKDVVELEYAEAQGLEIIKPFHLEEVIEQVIRSVKNAAQNRQQNLDVQIIHSPNQPLIGNPPLLRQMLENLISNAIKYTPPGGDVRLRLDAQDGYTVIEVTDTGIGIPPEELVKIWDRFYRVKSKDTAEIEGTGLGLSLVKSVAESHKGYIDVESEVGRGTTFRVWLPLTTEA